MASVVTSEVVFQNACNAVGLSEAVVTEMAKCGWNSYGTFACCTATAPGQDVDRFKTEVIKRLLGDEAHPDGAKLSRLHFEAFTFNTADLKRRLEVDQESAPKPIPMAELAHRAQALQGQIDPLKIEGRMEPSHALVNAVSQMLETGA
jgi:hypothetical protein